jgi:glycosyltransferase involved in cell wall biosynthesis
MTAGRVLHVAALPFPSFQGTQTLLHRLLEASAQAGRDAHLLCYAERGRELDHRYPVHRVGDFPRVRSLRSGPSLGKLLLDARMTASFERLRRRLAPELVIAHHVEAAALCLGRQATLFFAHTDLGAELPSYAPGLPGAPLTAAGRAVDHVLGRASAAVATVSPWLAERFGRWVAPEQVRYVPPPWPLPAPISAAERTGARAELGLSAASCVAVYAGNLDGYQSWPTLVEALARATTRAGTGDLQLLVVTASDTRQLVQAAHRAGVAARVRSLPLQAPGMRRAAHAAADLAVVPRGVPGGLPIKLLDALAHGLPTALMPAASAGLPLARVAAVAADASAEALAATLAQLARDAAMRAALAPAAREYIATHHAPSVCLAALDAISAVALRVRTPRTNARNAR